MNNKELKTTIQNALKACAQKNLAVASANLLNALGYHSDKTYTLTPNTPGQFQIEFDKQNELNPGKALLDDWVSVDVLFQVTDNELHDAFTGQKTLFASKEVSKVNIQSYLFFAVELSGKDYTRSELAQVTREINKLLPMPVMVVFRYDGLLSMGIITRRVNKRDASKDVLEKVTLIKDIRLSDPHRAHIEILNDLSLKELPRAHKLTNFADLQRAWEKTLDTNELNKKFYRDIANWYFWALNQVTFPDGAGKDEEKRNAASLIRLITRLIFVWFIKEKGLVPEDLFELPRVKTFLNFNDPNGSTYYKAILQNLFFATLNTEMGRDRKFRSENQGSGRDGNWMEHDRYRYKLFFKDPDSALRLFSDIPFLNGGLFECLDKEIEKNGKNETVRVDGFSDHPDNVLLVPDELFFSSEKSVDLNTVYDTRGKKYNVRGLLEIFHSYKFTIEENTPIEEEVALDPELLGKVFENLLASYNPETDVTARKQTGSFYTPREIVNYMVDEVLVQYLASKLRSGDNVEERLRHLLAYRDDTTQFTESEKRRLVNAIDMLKVIDPACGSGAFPIGILHKLVYILSKLDRGNQRWKAKQIAKANELEDSEAREAAIDSIEQVFEQNFNDYGRKLYLIENCIYGVDIQPIAVQISKLRVFISLVVDQKVDLGKPNHGIRPLPNLETKFVAANTLIGINRPRRNTTLEPEPETLSPALAARCEELLSKLRLYINSRNPNLRDQYLKDGRKLAAEINAALKNYPDFQPINVDWVFPTASSVDVLARQLPLTRPQTIIAVPLTSSNVDEIERELDKVRRNHFSARRPQEKRKYREQDADLRAQLMDAYRKLGLENDSAMKLVGWDPYDQNRAADFFDTEWMFNLHEGFDVTLGNPPYLRVQGIQKTQNEFMDYYRENFNSATGGFDLYALFIEKGYKLLNKGGQLAYIVPHKFLQASFGAGLRRMLTERQALRQLVRFGHEQIFEESTTYTCLLFLTSHPNKEFDLIEVKRLERGEDVLQAVRMRDEHSDFAFETLPSPKKDESWDFSIGEQNRILRRVLQHPDTLGSLTRKIFVGLQTSADKIYVLETIKNKGKVLICYSKHLDREIEIEAGLVKPFLMGKDVHRYEPIQARNVVLFPYFLDNDKAELMPQDYIQNSFPLGWEYLKEVKKALSDRERGRMKGKNFYAYIYPKNLTEFETVKIMTPDICGKPEMTIDLSGNLYHTTTLYSFVFKDRNANTKFYLGVLNSRLLWFFLSLTGTVLRNGYLRFKTEYLKPFPIAKSTPDQEHIIEILVDYILELKALLDPIEREKEVERRLMISYFEQLIDGLAYELYFPEEFSDAEKSLFDLLSSAELPSLHELPEEAETALQNLFHRLYDPNHAVRQTVYFLDTIEAVRIIEEKAKRS